VKAFPFILYVEYICGNCMGGFSSMKPNPEYCSHECYMEDTREKRSHASKLRMQNPEFRKRLTTARSLAGYADRNRPEAVARRKMRAAAKNALHRTLKGKAKYGNTFTLLGYAKQELIDHIESQFLPGMDWGNYGEWELDHIKPIHRFPNGTPVSTINALDNLRPLWKVDNRMWVKNGQ
jgi:hypothetical protein